MKAFVLSKCRFISDIALSAIYIIMALPWVKVSIGLTPRLKRWSMPTDYRSLALTVASREPRYKPGTISSIGSLSKMVLTYFLSS